MNGDWKMKWVEFLSRTSSSKICLRDLRCQRMASLDSSCWWISMLDQIETFTTKALEEQRIGFEEQRWAFEDRRKVFENRKSSRTGGKSSLPDEMESFSNQPSKPSFTQKTLNDWQPDFLIAWLAFTMFSINGMFTEMKIYVWENLRIFFEKMLFLCCFCFSFVLRWWTATAGWGKEVYIEVCYQDTAAPIRLRSHPHPGSG